jgi:serralysin
MNYIFMGDGDDEIFGTTGVDVIFGGGGVDIIFGYSGNDFLYGERGGDDLYGGSGNDLLMGGDGADHLHGGSDIDVADYYNSATGVIVSLLTNTGYSGAAFGDRLYEIENIAGSFHDDTLIGNDFDNVIEGRDGHDVLVGGGGSDRLIGGDGNNTLIGGAGADVLIGGAFRDVADYAASAAGVYVDLGAGYGLGGDADGDTLIEMDDVGGSAFGDTLLGQAAGSQLFGNGGGDFLQGLGATDSLSGGNGMDVLWGGGGADHLFGNAGDDILSGDAGADTMHGGRGYDTYWVDNPLDFVGEETATAEGADGIDLVYSSVSFNLAGSRVGGAVENLTLTGTGNLSGTGNALNNKLVGNSGDNTLTGGAGRDVLNGVAGRDLMRGGADHDSYYVDNAGDVVDESVAGSSGIDVVNAYVSFNLSNATAVRGNLEELVLLGRASLNGTGNALDNTIIGNAGANVIAGLAGDDWLAGGAGNDTFIFNTGLNAATNVDVISDFSSAQDTIQLENGVFRALTVTGALAAGALRVGPAALDADDRIVFNATTRALSYDADGNGAAAAIQFATLDTGHALPTGPVLTAADFVVI